MVSQYKAGKASPSLTDLHFAVSCTSLNSVPQEISTGQVQQRRVCVPVAFTLTVSPTLKS